MLWELLRMSQFYFYEITKTLEICEKLVSSKYRMYSTHIVLYRHHVPYKVTNLFLKSKYLQFLKWKAKLILAVLNNAYLIWYNISV